MDIESNKGGYKMTPEEEAHYKLTEREKALESLKRTLEKELTPEEVEAGLKAAREREETKPRGE